MESVPPPRRSRRLNSRKVPTSDSEPQVEAQLPRKRQRVQQSALKHSAKGATAAGSDRSSYSMTLPEGLRRCAWQAVTDMDPLFVRYHDEEWGTPQYDDRRLFEMLCLGGAQAGLSWATILRRRPDYARVFEGWDPEKLAKWSAAEIDQALQDPGIIRNRAKVASVVHNAKAFLAIQNDPSLGSFSDYLWSFIGGKDPKNIKATALSYYSEYPTQTEASAAMSNGLKSRGFRFVGPTICYAFMQTVGMVNDHSIGCYKQTATTADSTAK